MATLKAASALSVCLNVFLLITVLRQTFPYLEIVPRSSTIVRTEFKSVIRTADEALYVMYGEGNLTLADDDPRLLDYIRSMMSRQGPGGRRLSAKSSKVHFSQVGGSEFVDGLLRQRRNGFFVECGAFVGEHYSDTLFFEKERNWSGILIEGNPAYHRQILTKNRRALTLRGCLGSTRRPAFVKFQLAGMGSGISTLNKHTRRKTPVPETDVQCFPLNSIMAAIGVRHIDFMVLDVEGAELAVLQTIDWTRLSIDVFNIEYSGDDRPGKLAKLRRFFNETGRYIEVARLPLRAAENRFQDVVFMRA